MKTTVSAFALLAFAAAPAGQAQSDRARPSPEQRVERATAALDLTAQQQDQLKALLERHASSDDTSRWELAAEIETLLTDDQAQTLVERRNSKRSARADRGRGDRPQRADQGRRGAAAHKHLGLTDAQREQMKAQRRASKQARGALREQLQAGTITAEAFSERSKAIRAESSAAIKALLTPEQRERVETVEGRREAERAARETVLRITPDQRRAFEEARAEAARSGDRSEKREVMEEILTEDQRQIVAVHRAISPRHGHTGRKEGRRGERRERGGPAEG